MTRGRLATEARHLLVAGAIAGAAVPLGWVSIHASAAHSTWDHDLSRAAGLLVLPAAGCSTPQRARRRG